MGRNHDVRPRKPSQTSTSATSASNERVPTIDVMQGIECAGVVSSKYGVAFAQVHLDDICGSCNVPSILDYNTALPQKGGELAVACDFRQFRRYQIIRILEQWVPAMLE